MWSECAFPLLTKTTAFCTPGQFFSGQLETLALLQCRVLLRGVCNQYGAKIHCPATIFTARHKHKKYSWMLAGLSSARQATVKLWRGKKNIELWPMMKIIVPGSNIYGPCGSLICWSNALEEQHSWVVCHKFVNFVYFGNSRFWSENTSETSSCST